MDFERRQLLKIAGVTLGGSAVLASESLLAADPPPATLKSLKLKDKPTAIQGKKEVKASDLPPEFVAKATATAYVIWIINRSTYTVVGYKINSLPWTNCTPIGKTCTDVSCDACYNGPVSNGSPILAVSCTDSPFDFLLMLRAPNGQLYQAGPAHISPDCHYSGEVLCLDA